MVCYVYFRKALYANILLLGAGTSCFKSSGIHDEGTDGISSARDRPEALGASRAAEANSFSVFATKWRFSSENSDLSGYPDALVRETVCGCGQGMLDLLSPAWSSGIAVDLFRDCSLASFHVQPDICLGLDFICHQARVIATVALI